MPVVPEMRYLAEDFTMLPAEGGYFATFLVNGVQYKFRVTGPMIERAIQKLQAAHPEVKRKLTRASKG